MNTTAACGLIFLGLVFCFLGWRFFRLIMGVQGFIFGYYVMQRLLAQEHANLVVPLSIAAGAVLFILFYAFLYQWAFVVFGIGLGLTLAGVLDASFNFEPMIFAAIAIVAAVIGGLVGGMLADVMIRLSTAFSGAAQVIVGVGALGASFALNLPLADPLSRGVPIDSVSAVVSLVLWLVLGIAGFVTQSKSAPAKASA